MTTNIDVANHKGFVLLDFYSPTCMPCKAMNPTLDEIEKEYKYVTVAKINVSEDPDAAMKYGVMSVPTVIFLKDSKVKEEMRGFSGKEALKSMVRRHTGGMVHA